MPPTFPGQRGDKLASPLRAALYARTSRDPRKRTTSTRDQMEVNRREADYYGWTVVAEFIDDDRSASAKARKTRDEYEEMIRLVESGGCDVIVATETNRFLRSLEIYLHLRSVCKKMGVLWCVAGNVYDLSRRADQRATALDAVAAEDEAVGISERVQRTVRLNAERGNPHGRVLYGYQRKYDPNTGLLISQEPHPEEAKVVRDIFGRLAAGQSAYSIAKALEDKKPPKRQRWDGARMVEIASNPAYIGKRVYRGVIIGDATWKPLIDDKTWRAVQLILRDPGRQSMPDTVVRHLLSGIARCGVCECHCPMRVAKNRGYLTYQCCRCFCSAIRETKLDAYVEEALVEWLSKPESREILKPPPGSNAAFEEALSELEDLENQLSEARLKAADPNPRERLSVASLMTIEAGLQPLIDGKKKEVQALAPRSPVVELDGLLGAEDADARWNALTMERQRAVLRAVADVRVFKGGKGRRWIEPGRIVVKFGPQPNSLSGLGRRPW